MHEDCLCSGSAGTGVEAQRDKLALSVQDQWGWGGALHLDRSTASLTSCRLTGNSAGVRLHGAMRVTCMQSQSADDDVHGESEG